MYCIMAISYLSTFEISVALTFRVLGLKLGMLESRTNGHQEEALVTLHACHCISFSVQPAMKINNDLNTPALYNGQSVRQKSFSYQGFSTSQDVCDFWISISCMIYRPPFKSLVSKILFILQKRQRKKSKTQFGIWTHAIDSLK